MRNLWIIRAVAGFVQLSITLAGIGSPLIQHDADRPSEYVFHTISMPLNHFPDSPRYASNTKQTFQQRYFFDDTYYKPGGPVFLYLGGETEAESRVSNLQNGIIQILMNATNGLGVVLENRYYGESQPFNTSSTDELRFLTTEQTIADNAYFAQNAVFPGVEGSLNAPDTPWILYGGSLAGAHVAFSLVTYKDILWGGIGSSAVIHLSHSYPEWYKPIQKYGPQDCVARINGIIDKMDALIAANNTVAIQQLKEIFGLGSLSDIRDFAFTISWPLGNPIAYPTNTWQELNWYPAYDHPDFYWFCNNITNLDASKDVKLVDSLLTEYSDGEPWTGLGNYAKYVKDNVVAGCPNPDLVDTSECFNTQNESCWADTTNTANRAWLYQVCTEYGTYTTAPSTGPSLISRVLQSSYIQQWCGWSFPPGKYNSINPDGPDLSAVNRYGDFNISAPRLAFIDGSADTWLDLCFHSEYAPPRQGPNQYLIPGAGHHWDSYGILDLESEPDEIRAAHEWEIRRVKVWLKEFKELKRQAQTQQQEKVAFFKSEL